MAVGFNAGADYAKRTGSPAFTMTGDSDKFTISGWMMFRVTTASGNWAYGLGVEDADSSANKMIMVGIDDSDVIGVTDLSEWFNDAFSPAPSVDTWYYFYITGSNNGSGFVTHNAGYYAASGSSPEDTVSLGNVSEYDVYRVSIGNNSLADSLDCALAYVRVWTGVVLTDSELRTERDSASAVKTSGLWADWPLADNTDTGDDSGNGRTLTFNGTLTTEDGPLDVSPGGSVTADAAILDTLTGSVTANAALEGSLSNSFTVDSVLVSELFQPRPGVAVLSDGFFMV